MRWNSHAALRHSRVTVARDTAHVSATSCSVSPPKYQLVTIQPDAESSDRRLGERLIEQ